MAVIQGFTRNRSHQLGKQTVHGTAVAATREVHWQGVPDINPNWTDLDNVDVGSIDRYLSPYRMQTDITIPYAGPLSYNDIHVLFGGGVRGGVTGTGGTAAKTWNQTALSTTATTLDEYTDEWGDDVTADGVRIRDVVFEDLDFTFDESLGPVQFSATGRGGYFDPNVVPTAGLTVGSNLPLVFGADASILIDDTAAGIGSTTISDALHRANVHIANTIDQKRYANGSNSRFAIGGYGLAGREITASFTFAKVSAIYTSETLAKWLNASPQTRYVRLFFSSTQLIGATASHYTWNLSLAGTWRARGDEEIGGNAVIRLDLVGQYDSVLGYSISSVVVNDRATNP